jgi:hypothetical protein
MIKYIERHTGKIRLELVQTNSVFLTLEDVSRCIPK